MIQLALEIPTSLLATFTPLTELDFALAHRVLEDEAYCSFYRNRAPGRELILDNSMHELGKPLSPNELLLAVRKVQADFLIAPDELGQPAKNLSWFKETQALCSNDCQIAVVMCGNTPEERATFLNQVRYADMLCMPFREDRFTWFEQHAPTWQRVHLLGVSSLEELAQWVTLEKTLPRIRFSVDTSKPIKAAMVGRRIDDGKSLRGISISSKDLLGLSTFTPTQLDLIGENIMVLQMRLLGLP